MGVGDGIERIEMSDLCVVVMESKVWFFEEVCVFVKCYEKVVFEKGYVLFEMGYGLLGLLYIGIFGEVLWIIMICNVFEVIFDILICLICFLDDFDGMCKVLGNVLN